MTSNTRTDESYVKDLSKLLRKIVEGEKVHVGDCDTEYVKGFRSLYRLHAEHRANNGQVNNQTSSDESAKISDDKPWKPAWRPIKPETKDIDTRVEDKFPRTNDKRLFSTLSIPRNCFRDKPPMKIGSWDDECLQLFPVRCAYSTMNRDRVMKAPVEEAWESSSQSEHRRFTFSSEDAFLNEICAVMASRLTYLVVEGWETARIAHGFSTNDGQDIIDEMVKKLQSKLERKASPQKIISSVMGTWPAVLVDRITEEHRPDQDENLAQTTFSSPPSTDGAASDIPGREQAGIYSWEQTKTKHPTDIPLPTTIHACQCWEFPKNRSWQARGLVAHLAMNLIAHYSVLPTDFVLDHSASCAVLECDADITGYSYTLSMTRTRSSVPQNNDQPPTGTVLQQDLKVLTELVSSRPHDHCGRTRDGTLMMCRCNARHFEQCWRELKVNALDIVALRVLRGVQMRKFCRRAQVMWVVLLALTALYIGMAIKDETRESIINTLLFGSGLAVGLTRVFSEFFHEDQDITDFAVGCTKNTDLLSSMTSAMVWLTKPAFAVAKDAALRFLQLFLTMRCSNSEVKWNGFRAPVHRVKSRTETGKVHFADVLGALVYSRETSKVVTSVGTSSIAMYPIGKLQVNHNIKSCDLKKQGVVVSDTIAAMPGPKGLKFGAVRADVTGRYYIEWGECEKGVAGSMLPENAVVG